MADQKINFDAVTGARLYREADLSPVVELFAVRATADPRKAGKRMRLTMGLEDLMRAAGMVRSQIRDEIAKVTAIKRSSDAAMASFTSAAGFDESAQEN